MKVVNTPSHPEAQEIILRVHPNTITNNQIRSMLGLMRDRERDIEALPQNFLKAHFKDYSVFAKAYHTQGGPNEFFGNLACFLLVFGYVHARAYSMPKKKASIIITAYQSGAID